MLLDAAPQRANGAGAERGASETKLFVDVVERMSQTIGAECAVGVGPKGPRPILVGGHGLSPETKPMRVTDGLDVWQREAAFAP